MHILVYFIALFPNGIHITKLPPNRLMRAIEHVKHTAVIWMHICITFYVYYGTLFVPTIKGKI